MKIIRLTLSEYKQIPKGKKNLTLFYYKDTTNKNGEEYTLAKILKFGMHKKNGKEILPKLSFKNTLKVKCIEVKNNIQYKNISKDLFKNSLNKIQDIDSLRKSIQRKYLKSRPYLTKEDILKNGVAYTIFEIIN